MHAVNPYEVDSIELSESIATLKENCQLSMSTFMDIRDDLHDVNVGNFYINSIMHRSKYFVLIIPHDI